MIELRTGGGNVLPGNRSQAVVAGSGIPLVMATFTDGTQRMAWEAQLSPITMDGTCARTERYQAEEIPRIQKVAAR